MSHARPNILFVTTDQQHPDWIGTVNPRLPTPALNRLAAEGATFLRSYSCSPLCTPTRASWITGQYPFRHGAWSVGTVLNPRCVTLPALLGGAGYRTAIIGKSHMEPGEGGGSTESYPRSRDTERFRRWTGPWYGFDYAQLNVGHVDERHAASMHYGAWLVDHGIELERYFGHSRPSQRPEPSPWDLPERFHACAWASERSIAYLEDHAREHADRPFFLMLNFPEPHSPFRVPEPWFSRMAAFDPGRAVRRCGEWRDKPEFYRAIVEQRKDDLAWYDRYTIPGPWAVDLPAALADGERLREREIGFRRAYAAMIALMDHHLGRVLETLDRLGLTEDTLVVFTSDHGDMLGDHFLWGKGPLHYDSCVRVPTLVRWPGVTPAGSVSSALVSGVDLAPTFLDAAGLPIHPDMQGCSQRPALRDVAVNVRDGVLVDHRAEKGYYVNSWITPQHRLSVHTGPGRPPEFELYDLAADPHEFTNLAALPAHASELSRLMGQMLHERAEQEQSWQPRIAFA